MTLYRCSDESGSYQRTLGATSADEAAEDWAEIAHNESAGEWCSNNSGTALVQELDENGDEVGEAQTFEISVDWSPTFTAHQK